MTSCTKLTVGTAEVTTLLVRCWTIPDLPDLGLSGLPTTRRTKLEGESIWRLRMMTGREAASAHRERAARPKEMTSHWKIRTTLSLKSFFHVPKKFILTSFIVKLFPKITQSTRSKVPDKDVYKVFVQRGVLVPESFGSKCARTWFPGQHLYPRAHLAWLDRATIFSGKML